MTPEQVTTNPEQVTTDPEDDLLYRTRVLQERTAMQVVAVKLSDALCQLELLDEEILLDAPSDELDMFIDTVEKISDKCKKGARWLRAMLFEK